MTNTCPSCNKAVDPLRSRFVAVRGGKVVAFCSAECAQVQGAAPPATASRAAPPATASHAVSPATGVPTAIPTPATGVPIQPPAASARTRTPASGIAVGPPMPVTPAPGVPISADSGPVIEILHEPASGVVTSARDERSESRGVGTPTALPAGRGSSPAGSTERSESRGLGTALPAGRGSSPAGSTERSERTEPRAKHPDEIPMAAFWSADKESGAVRVVNDVGSAPVKAPAAGRDDTTLSKWTTDDTAELRGARAASEGDVDEDVPPRRTGRLRIAILIVLLLGAGGLLVYQYLVKNGLAAATSRLPAEPATAEPAAAAAMTPGAAPPAAPAEVAPAVARAATVEPQKITELAAVDVSAAVGRARAVLEADLTATSPRLQRLAAAALARTQHPAARELLAAHIAQGTAGDLSEIARLDLAYSLARSGDKRGGDALAAGLRSGRADVRDEAARLLALLGDRRAVSHLTNVLAVTQRRLGAAEHLAHLEDANALKILEQVWSDAGSSANDKSRAAIALAIAGRRDVAPALRAMLSDPHFNAFAAAALAELRDRSAQPVLVHQLESPALVVRAARALRRLDPALDPRPALPHLLEVLRVGRDTDQVQAAEAILLLAGPETLSTYN
jgi:hypothetical protein